MGPGRSVLPAGRSGGRGGSVAAGVDPAPNVSRSQACCSAVKGGGVSLSVAIAA